MLIDNLKVCAFILGCMGLVRATDLPPVKIVGNKFFFSNNGSQFLMRGIAYQAEAAVAPNGHGSFYDPLADFTACSRDIQYLKMANTNTIRVYAVNNTLDHSKCMQAFNDAGIYVIADLSEPNLSINRDSPEWTIELFERYASVVDELQKYSNVLGFFAGNEVTNNKTNTAASAFVKAAVRDTKAYIKQKGYREIPVGYSSNDDGDTRQQIADYFACGSEEERADFYGINMYEWCGDSTFRESGYADRTKEFSNLGIPLFFSEYGCNEIRPRKFSEVQALYSSDMTDIWSGGIVYMFHEEANGYGLVKIDNGKVTTLPDFDNYVKAIGKIKPTIINSSTYSPTKASVTCPTPQENWKAVSSLPPSPNKSVCSCMRDSLSCVVADSVAEKDYETLFSYVCSQISCSSILANSTDVAAYGAYSFCSPKEKLSFVLDQYYKSQKSSPSACSFSGSALLQKPSPTASTCKPILDSIGSAGTGSFHTAVYLAHSGPNGIHSTSKNAAPNDQIGAQRSLIITFISAVIALPLFAF